MTVEVWSKCRSRWPVKRTQADGAGQVCMLNMCSVKSTVQFVCMRRTRIR